MVRKQAKVDFSLDTLLGTVAAGIKNPKKNNLQYQPHEKQQMFHLSSKPGRQYIGGNRSGKTTAGINEDIWWMTGRHPFLELPKPPIFGRIVTVDFKNGANMIIVPQLRQWLAPSDLINGSWEDSYNKQSNVLTLENGSQLEIMSHEQDLDKFAGVPRHFIHFDEECPQNIYKECLLRLVDYNGRWWMTMTPVDGMTWTLDVIYGDGHGATKNIDIIHADIEDNPHLEEGAIETVLSGLTEDEIRIRKRGEYVAVSGLIFKHFDPEIHVRPSGIPPNNWTHYRSFDHGYNNPTAVYWHAIDTTRNILVTYKEHYRAEWVVEQHAELIKQVDEELLKTYGIQVFLGVADPAIRQRSPVTGHSIQIEYALNGVNWALSSERGVKAGLDKMNNYLRLGKWFITEDCPNLIREIRRYKWADYSTSKTTDKNNKKEQPQKKDDHGCDSCRYLFSFMPVLDLKTPKPEKEQIIFPELLDVGSPRRVYAGGERYDPSFKGEEIIQMPQYDEFVGEF